MRLKSRIIRMIATALITATLVFTVASSTPKAYSVQWYTGYFYPNWWNPFVWCSWQMWQDDNGNYDYWDTCGGSSSYLSLN